MAGSAADAVFAVLLVGMASLVGVAVMDPIATSDQIDQGGETDSVADLDGLNWVEADTGVLGRGTSPNVTNSLGKAADLNESDSSIQASAGIDPAEDDTWTAAQTVWVDNTTSNQTVLALGSPDVIVSFRYDGSTDTRQWVVHYIGNQETYDVALNATDASNRTTLVVWQNNSTLTISEDATTNASVTLSGTHTTTWAANASGTLDGRLDETRTYKVVLPDSQRSALVSDPVYPLDVTDSQRGARLMYDRLGPLPAYFIGGDASTTNVTLASGLPGEVMQRADVLGNGDYRWGEDSIEIKPLDGGKLDGHPAAFVTYQLSSAGGSILVGFSDAMQLVPVIMIVLLAAAILGIVQRFR